MVNLSIRNLYNTCMCVQEEMERVDEEDWLLQDVIFVEDSRNIPVGKVLKVIEISTHFFSWFNRGSKFLCSSEKQNKLALVWAQSTHRVATAAFWSTFHHDGKIIPGWWGVGGARPRPFTIFTITYKVAVYGTLQLSGQRYTRLISTLPIYVRYSVGMSTVPGYENSFAETKTHCYIVQIFVKSVCAKLWWPLAHTLLHYGALSAYSVLDPNRIGSRFNQVSGSGSRRAKTKIEKS